MKAADLYDRLEKDFAVPGIVENWYDCGMSVNGEYICEEYKQRSTGLLCDFAEEIGRVYTAVFPSDRALIKILDDNATDAMLFLHHPQVWDLCRDPDTAFYQMNGGLLKKFRERRVSLFNFHYPLDHFSPYSTSRTLADRLGISIEKPFAMFGGAICGVIGVTGCKDIHELRSKYSQAVGHETKLYQYGEDTIINGRAGVCAGGGNDPAVVKELMENGVYALITGLSLNNAYSSESHRLEKENRINLIGGTHYSSEKFACMEMCKYFNELGLQSEFIDDIPCLDDM